MPDGIPTNRVESYPYPDMSSRAKFKAAFLAYIPAIQGYHTDIEQATSKGYGQGYEHGKAIPMPCLFDAAEQFFYTFADTINSDGLTPNKLAMWFCKTY